MRVTGLVIGDGWGWGVKTESKNCMNYHSVLSRQRQKHGSYEWCLVVKCSYKLSLCPLSFFVLFCKIMDMKRVFQLSFFSF